MPEKTIPTIRLASIAILAGLSISMLLVKPQELGPFGITVWFSVLLVAITGFITLWLWRRYDDTREGFLLALRRGFVISVWVVALLALNSLRQLDIRDIILIIILGLLVDFYWRRIEK